MAGDYQVVLADPSWLYGDLQKHRPANYRRMRLKDIRAMGPWVSSIAAKDAVLFIWSTGPMMLHATRMFLHWGFVYKTIAFDWAKITKEGDRPKNTQGHYTLPNHEYCLIGVRGSLPVIDHTVRQEIREPPREHSSKPDCVRERIVQMYGDVPRIELFARGPVPSGWSAWGDEAEPSEGYECSSMPASAPI